MTLGLGVPDPPLKSVVSQIDGQSRSAIARPPPEGIAPLVVRQMLEHLLALNRSGATILLSGQNLDFSLKLADRVYIIEKGEILYTGTPESLAADSEAPRT
jgi:branched-chain amino acid transport system ATP-binding protein